MADMLQIGDLVHLNAVRNGVTIVFLALGLYFIRRGEPMRHRAVMIAAATVSAGFLVSYLTYHFNSGLARFGGEGVVRPIYFAILVVHVIAAAVITPLVPITLFRALSRRFDRHRRLARWTWPLWMYVAVSGVVVYVMSVYLYPWSGAMRAAG
jgi:putative membrane protein